MICVARAARALSTVPTVWEDGQVEVRPCEGDIMSKRGRKRRARAKKGANHGKRPNA